MAEAPEALDHTLNTPEPPEPVAVTKMFAELRMPVRAAARIWPVVLSDGPLIGTRNVLPRRCRPPRTALVFQVISAPLAALYAPVSDPWIVAWAEPDQPPTIVPVLSLI